MSIEIFDTLGIISFCCVLLTPALTIPLALKYVKGGDAKKSFVALSSAFVLSAFFMWICFSIYEMIPRDGV